MSGRDDTAVYDLFLAADHAASVAHDFIWGKNGVTQQEASDAIWAIHNALRPYIVLDGDDVAGDLEGKLPTNEHTMLRARALYERGDLLGAALREADACENDGYHITAAILRDLVARVEKACLPVGERP